MRCFEWLTQMHLFSIRCEMWDSMIENVKKEIYQHEGKEGY